MAEASGSVSIDSWGCSTDSFSSLAIPVCPELCLLLRPRYLQPGSGNAPSCAVSVHWDLSWDQQCRGEDLPVLLLSFGLQRISVTPLPTNHQQQVPVQRIVTRGFDKRGFSPRFHYFHEL